uniref:Si:ch211-176g6.2 n=1 Tax=Poecilia latipinna TaxID=48699 RepID=A0A3B3V0L0_9TELE
YQFPLFAAPSSRSGVSTGSSSTCRSAEGVAIRQPNKSRISLFSAEVLPEDDPSELSNQITAPGILKIFGNEICEGAHYKSVLATTHSSAGELVKERTEKEKEKIGGESDSYVLCDTIGSIDSHQWRTEGFRVVGDHEKPLLLQSLWKPREGLARRFEIQRKSSIEEKTSKERDTVTAGINAQARKLQKSRSRVTSSLVERTLGRSQKLWRSKSEMDLLDGGDKSDGKRDARAKSLRESLGHSSVHSRESLENGPRLIDICSTEAPFERDGGTASKTENLSPPRPRGEREGEESEREETESSDDNTTQYSIHPPHDCPYLLLLQGWSLTQDFIIYLLAAPHILIGRRGECEDKPSVDVVLFADDILPSHCSLHRHGVGSTITLSPCKDAAVSRNGKAVKDNVQLSSGDIIGLGKHYLFLFRDPLPSEESNASPEPTLSAAPWIMCLSPPAAATIHSTAMIHCINCIPNCTDFRGSARKRSPNKGPPFLTSPRGHILTLSYRIEDEDRVVKEIFAMDGTSIITDGAPLTVSFLLSLCLQYATAYLHTSDLRRLLLLSASEVQSATWVSLWLERLETKRRVKFQSVFGLPQELSTVSRAEWISESHRFSFLSNQFLYTVLPSLLDCNPFRESAGDCGRGLGGSGMHVPMEISQVVEVLDESWRLLLDCQVHPEVSSQLIGYLFYFINASLFNSLMERGSEPGFYQWSRGVRMRANLDLVLDWAHAAGLGELALEHTHTLSSAINLLATPRKNLLQTPWASLRSDYPALSPAQLHHLLSLYSPASPCAQTPLWNNPGTDILESFDTHHPLELPDEGYLLQLRRPILFPFTHKAAAGRLFLWSFAPPSGCDQEWPLNFTFAFI